MTVSTDPRKTGVNAGMSLLAASAVAASHTGTIAQTTLATVAIPAGSMGLNGGLRIMYNFSYTNNANNKTVRLKLGATTLRTTIRTTAVYDSVIDTVKNRNSASSQLVELLFLLGNGSISLTKTTAAENTSQTLNVEITAELAVATDNFTLESYEVWLLP